MAPKISVITTVYNCELYIRESIESILSQSFADFEFIIINDGSVDKTTEIIRLFRDDRIRFFDNDDNRKIPHRRNEAIGLARGEYIAIHDGDDVSLPDRLLLQIENLAKSDVFCVGGWATKIDISGNVIGEMNYAPAQNQDVIRLVTKKCMNPIIDPTTMFRRSDFLALGGYTLDREIYTVPDFDLWLRAILSGKKFINIQQPLIKYRVNPEGMTGTKKQEMIAHHMKVWRNFMASWSVKK